MVAPIARWTRYILRRMLIMDQPAAWRSEEDLRAEQYRNFRWNFTFNFLDGVFFWLGLAFISYTTILPLFVSKITTNPLPIALLAVIGQAGWYIPQLFSAGWTEKLDRKKPVVINLGFFTERLPLWLLPVAAILAPGYPILGLGIFFWGYAWHGLGAGIIAPAWTDMVARCFPVAWRGRFFGLTAFAGTGLGAAGALLSGWLLATLAYPLNFTIIFLLAAIAINLSWAFLSLTREPVQPVSEAVRHQAGWSTRKFSVILRGDRNFRLYLISRGLVGFGNMAAGFITVSAIQRWSVPDATVGLYTTVLLIGQTTGNLVAGFISDRMGHKVSLQMGTLALGVAYLIALLAPAPIFYYAVFFILGAAVGAIIVSGVLVSLEFSLPEHRPSYVGMANTTAGIGNILGPLLGGLIALVSYNLLFAVSALFAASSLFMLTFYVRDPRHEEELFDVSRALEEA